MYQALRQFAQQPQLFCEYTAPLLWNDPHVSQQMLSHHLNPDTDFASRSPEKIDRSVEWIDRSISLSGKTVCDLGCGPGLYATRFHDRGAKVIGLDVSRVSLDYAERTAEESGRTITYRHADYTQIDLPRGCDVYTLIYFDFCVLSPPQRADLLARIGEAMDPDGRLILDVHASQSFASVVPTTLVEPQLMDGFWSQNEYVGFKKTYTYPADFVSLDRYLIVEADRSWEIFNWLQYFSKPMLEAELGSAGFNVEQLAGSIAGGAGSAAGAEMAVIALRR